MVRTRNVANELRMFFFVVNWCPATSWADKEPNKRVFSRIFKGQIISECPYEIIVWTKILTKKFPRFLP